jgi:hypothetical protein
MLSDTSIGYGVYRLWLMNQDGEISASPAKAKMPETEYIPLAINTRPFSPQVRIP